MKQLLILASFLISISAFAQLDSLQVGKKWPFQFSYIRTTPDSVQLHPFNFSEGLATVTYNSKIGFIDSSKTIVIPLLYEYGLGANRFINSRSVVVKDSYWGVIDKSGKEVIPFNYGEISARDSLYCVYEYEGDRWGYLDWSGNELLPIRAYHVSSIMKLDEIQALAVLYRQKDSLENAAAIPKSKAIRIAKSKGYWIENSGVFSPSVVLDSDANEWIISSTKRKGVTRKGDCAHTNGCIVQVRYLIKIDSNTGRVTKKSKQKVVIPVYE